MLPPHSPGHFDDPELVRRVEAGEQIAITVAGRPAAKLVPAAAHTWRQWNDIAELFTSPDDPEWAADRDRIAHEIRDPFNAQ